MISNDQLFDKVIVFGDIHFGKKNNSRTHNEDCEQFIIWMIEQAKKQNIKTCIFMGDWHDSRHSINVRTLNYTVNNLQRLNDNFDEVYMIMGNHDLYYREKRDINSLPMADQYPNITVINHDILIKGNVAIVPWLVEDEWKTLKKIKAKFMFGHFELPHFYMNAMVQMPDHGGLQQTDLAGVEKVFSGHFHKRQERGNVVYPGNCFPHNYADAWEDDRGCMILDWDGTYDLLNWEDGPKYRTVPLSQLIDDPDSVLGNKTYCRITLDIPISYEEANFIKETFAEQYNLREISLMPSKKGDHSTEWQSDSDIEIENVDQIVYNQLKAVDSQLISTKTLMDIYANL